eukprot:COSAG02_NODE_108_length_36286_cov_19.437478_21_plen_802_part_00
MFSYHGVAYAAAATCALAVLANPVGAGTLEKHTNGFGPENATQHAGYIAVNQKNGNDGHLFYWMFEARRDPSTAPLVLWLTGGPGCSSELAVFYEQGPYRLDKEGNVKINPHSWTEIANVLFVDQPVGTGFSFADNSDAYVKTEDGVATDMWEFLQTFMVEFPQYAQLDFYVTGESYAGHYVPAISSRIVANNKKLRAGEHTIHLQGIAIGNGLVDPETQYGQYVPYALDKGLITRKQATSLNRTAHACQRSILAGHKGTVTLMECNSMLERIMLDGGGFNTYDVRIKCAKPPLCYDFAPLDTLMARDDVRKALGVSPKANWQSCNMKVHEKLMSDWFTNMETVIPAMLEDDVRVLVYSGQEDFICNWFGGRAWVDKMQWSGAAQYHAQKWSEWKVSTMNAGTFKEHGPLTFLGVANAGHMVPMDQGENALAMLHTFVNGKSFNCDAGSRRDMVGCDSDATSSDVVVANATIIPMPKDGHGDYCFACSQIVNYALQKGCDAILCDVVAGNFGPRASTYCKKLERTAGMFGHSLCDYINKNAHLQDNAEAICNDLNCEGDGPTTSINQIELDDQSHAAGSVSCDACTTIIDGAIGEGCDEFACAAFGPYAPACAALEAVLGLFGDSFCDWVQRKAGTGEDVQEICTDLGACSSTFDSMLGESAVGEGSDTIVVANKNATLAFGSACDSFYELRGGFRERFRGRYEQYGPASTSCNGKPVYKNADGSTDYYLFASDSGNWMVGLEDRMHNCQATGFIHSAGSCTCPNSAGCKGNWVQNTGQNSAEGHTCSANTWCPDCGLWWH